MFKDLITIKKTYNYFLQIKVNHEIRKSIEKKPFSFDMKTKRKSSRKTLFDIKNQLKVTQTGIPMKDRTFPASFWHAPNRPNQNIRNNHNGNKGQLLETRTGRIKITSPPDTNLLFSLFKILECEQIDSNNDGLIKKDKTLESKRISSLATISGQSFSDENTNELSESDDKDDDDDDNELDDILDDPYLSTKQNLNIIGNGNTMEVSKNYSDILSNLVVNL